MERVLRTASCLVLVACGTTVAPASDPGWMAAIDDTRLLSDLSIPGTHESAALYEPFAGSAKCQTLTLADQLAAGVRYFDIRCRHLDDAFSIFHGPIDELQSFDQVLATMTDFLDGHPTETVVISIKEESTPANTTRTFDQTFAAYVARDPARWHLGAAVPSLGEVRGKLVLLRRFDAVALPLGIAASPWADHTTFSISTADASLRVQDAYQVTSDDAKWLAISSLLAESGGAVPSSTLYLNYTSGYQTHGSPLPDIPSVATVINPRFESFLLDPANAHAHLGVMAMDFVDKTRALAVARTNLP